MVDKTTATGIGGARRLPTARDLVAFVINENPKGPLPVWLRRFEEVIEYNPHTQPQVNEHYFISIERDMRASKTKSARDEARTRSAARIRVAADGMKRSLLMSWMSNGKRMGDCTGAEIGAEGKGYERVAEVVGPDRKCRDVLTEEQVRKLMAPRRGAGK